MLQLELGCSMSYGFIMICGPLSGMLTVEHGAGVVSIAGSFSSSPNLGVFHHHGGSGLQQQAQPHRLRTDLCPHEDEQTLLRPGFRPTGWCGDRMASLKSHLYPHKGIYKFLFFFLMPLRLTSYFPCCNTN